ncbi:hypothetical protein MVES1_000787 [Malassezia vespertilionis]|uniref:Uncharacterized protein n=1 Tax=Malassezia vespertilionis TaxID=2020962 RepID=A0A2N1JH10_9BASI|nr:uncharacterized protein MVES1_000787 [Malassezia vespertilionis]PKI85832.1 hypothetical protein MVES_000740 [Malassezia vespertilionis]WFD05457.1 hypothetical protein MVES1_000787 [Malassezia vespertilionis]
MANTGGTFDLSGHKKLFGKDGKYIVAGIPTDALVEQSLVSDHLKLLSAFDTLRASVLYGEYVDEILPSYTEAVQGMVSSAEKAQKGSSEQNCTRWIAFLTRALARFETYISQVLNHANTQAEFHLQLNDLDLPPFFAESEYTNKMPDPLVVPDRLLPPLDVLMIWHTYLLNPSRYNEDIYLASHRSIFARYEFPLAKAARMIDNYTLEYSVAVAEPIWGNLTGESFDPLHAPSNMTSVACHVCEQPQSVSWEDLCTGDWRIKCADCNIITTPSNMRAKKWVEHVERWQQGTSDMCSYRLHGGALSAYNGRFFTTDPYAPILNRVFASGRVQNNAVGGMTQRILGESTRDVYGKVKLERKLPREVYEAAGHDMEAISQILYESVQADMGRKLSQKQHHDLYRRTSLMMSYYLELHPLSAASIDLVAATERQFRFIESIKKLGWLAPGGMPNLDNAILRYHAWLNIAGKGTKMLCPTLDIDLVWHTHQLARFYYWDMFRLVSRFVDHNDRVEKTFLRGSFNDTVDIWVREYNRPYSVCGCNEHRSKYETTKKLLSHFKGKARKKDSEGEIANANEDVTPLHPTYPSVHSAVTKRGSEAEQERNDVFDHVSPYPEMEPFFFKPAEDCTVPGKGTAGVSSENVDGNASAVCMQGAYLYGSHCSSSGWYSDPYSGAPHIAANTALGLSVDAGGSMF